MTLGAGNNIKPNRYQLASIKYENATNYKFGAVPKTLGGDRYPSQRTKLPSVGTRNPSAGTATPRRGLLPLGGDRHYAIYPIGGLLEDCKFKHENP